MSNKGLGDIVSHVIKKVSGGRIKECGGCKKRQRWLNEKVPYSNNLNILTDALFKSKTKHNN